MRHLYLNFEIKNENQGNALKDVIWKAARATYMKEFTDAISEMRSMSDALFKWMQGISLELQVLITMRFLLDM
ncbi:hypothetical protein V6N13_109317 [Hibiscus sabdariffa]